MVDALMVCSSTHKAALEKEFVHQLFHQRFEAICFCVYFSSGLGRQGL
jgi:hypothetical protein